MNESNSMVQRTADYVKRRLDREKTGHDWFHIYRVWQISKLLQEKEGGDRELIELAALLHSATEENFVRTDDESFRSLAMYGMMDVLGIDDETKKRIINISNYAHYKGIDSGRPNDLEGKIVQDANWLDGLGAIGIGRVFTAGGYLGRRIYDPALKPNPNIKGKEFFKRKKEGTSYNYFFEKSLKSAEALNTETAKKIAGDRVKFMKIYLDRLMLEWNQGDAVV